MFIVVKSWDNRGPRGKLKFVNGRSWTRRCQWLEDQAGAVKLKFEVADAYKEVMIPQGFAQIVWDRFKGGMSIEDCVSVFASPVPQAMLSRKGSKQ